MPPSRVLPRTGARPLSDALLARGERHLLSPEDRRRLRGQRVLITGAAGTLGTALASRIATLQPGRLALFDISDSGLVRLERDLARRKPALPVAAVLGDVTRAGDVRHAIRQTRPDVVFHLAASNEVSAAERAVCAAVRTNVFGALHVARETALAGARLVLVSTSEAGEASTVLAATQRLAELVSFCPSYPGFRPVVAQIPALVDGPSGPVQSMIEQLREGRALLVANASAEIQLMTTAEAVSLILKADAVGEEGDICRLDTGMPVRLTSVADRLLEWAGHAGVEPVPVQVASQSRPVAAASARAEEQVFAPGPHRWLRMRREAPLDTVAISRILRALRHDLRRLDGLAVLASLGAALPRFQPSRLAREVAAVATLHAAMPAPARASLPLSA